MYPQKKQVNSTMSPNKLSEDGRKKIKLKSKKQKVVIEDIKFPLKQDNHSDPSSMLESQAKNNLLISNIKSNSSEVNIQNMKSLQILVAESILKEKASEPFWSTYSETMSKKLLFPIETDGVDSDLIFSNGSFTNMDHNSFLYQIKNPDLQIKNLLKTYYPLSQSTQPNITEAKNIKYSRKIRIYPSSEQKSFFQKCFGTTRFFYNKTIDFIKNNSDVKYTLPFLRSHVMKSNKDLDDDELWQNEIPYDTRQLAIKDVVSAYSSAFKLIKKKIINSFDMKFKSKKDNTQIFHVNDRAININMRLFKSKLSEPLRVRKKMKTWIKNNLTEIKSDCIVTKDKIGRYYLHVPQIKKQENIKDKNEIVSLDPGVRTFQTFYSPNGLYGKLGDNKVDELYKYGTKIDLLTSLRAKIKEKRTRYNMHIRCFKLRTKIKNIINDLHWKSASFLCKNFENILIPKFETQKMSLKLPDKIRKISSKSVRMMMTLSHYKFKERLIYKASNYKNCNVYEVREDWTSKTCGGCGNIDYKLEGKKIYNCDKCGLKIDRDMNGARNILLKIFG